MIIHIRIVGKWKKWIINPTKMVDKSHGIIIIKKIES